MLQVKYVPPRNEQDRVVRLVQRSMRGGSVGDVVVLNPGETANVTLDDSDGIMLTAVESQALRTGITGPRGTEAQLFGNNSEMDVLLTPPQGVGPDGKVQPQKNIHGEEVEEPE